MQVKCEGCGSFHNVSPTAMMVIIYALQQGDLQRMTGKGVRPLCLGDALTPEAVAKHKAAKGNVLVFDKDRWVGKAA